MKPTPTTTRLVAAMLVLAASLAPSVASARTTRDFEYPYAQVWNALVRLIRVDNRFPVDEIDDEHGFLLFQYRAFGRSHPASIELVRTPTTRGERVRVVVQLGGMPAATEARMVDELVAKLRSDYGNAPTATPPGEGERTAESMIPRLSPAPSRIPTDPPAGGRDVTPPSPDAAPAEPPQPTQDGVRRTGGPTSARDTSPAAGTGRVILR